MRVAIEMLTFVERILASKTEYPLGTLLVASRSAAYSGVLRLDQACAGEHDATVPTSTAPVNTQFANNVFNIFIPPSLRTQLFEATHVPSFQ